MCRTLIFIFDRPEASSDAREALNVLHKRGVLELEASLVLTRDGDGPARVVRAGPKYVLVSAVIGGLMGLLLTFMFPVVSVVFGVCAGAIIGWLITPQKIEPEFVADAQAALPPGSSALLIGIHSRDAGAVGSALRGLGARVYQTTLLPEHELLLRQAVENGAAAHARTVPAEAGLEPQLA